MSMAFVFLACIVLTGIVCLVDTAFLCFCKSSRVSKAPALVTYCRYLFPALIMIFAVRSFLYSPYRVPTGSLAPTVLSGDVILVNKYVYGLHLPVWNKMLISVSTPKRGDIVVFYHPINQNITLLKRVVGLPGDHISYINKVLYINGTPLSHTYLSESSAQYYPGQAPYAVKQFRETFAGKMHSIYLRPNVKGDDFYNIIVPKHDYFVMGDNRDASDDSRYWGFVPEHDLIGKAEYVLWSWNSLAAHLAQKIRFSRIGAHLS